MKKLVLICLTLTLALILVACGAGEEDNASDNNQDSAATGSGETVDLIATNWKFDQEEYTVPAGEVTVNLTSKEGFHGIVIENSDVSIEGEGSATTTLEPGEYTIRCSVPCGTGHSEMTATLVVQ
ncbi:cytochrome C oxidase subunit II [Gracilibacillus caseinilyticus]|uniref:Cytochrome C oxidase subunit II n=1 Tax=Gracilibacillus caseinilyticus TaxID=2932256 RepID=A0ABY4ERF9_9BACI|nr:cytochrome C oxidase subunit II [Gracilibacillus caseinilyticus]UOQ47020.1 cytochrome C oxidase subunit II [Gracilibacillus caseinilyticus]